MTKADIALLIALLAAIAVATWLVLSPSRIEPFREAPYGRPSLPECFDGRVCDHR